MNLKDLYYFYDLSNLQSFTDVARKHEVSQPSISYAIKRLEKEFHCQLILHDPSHRTFRLTPQGDILLRHVKKVLPELQVPKRKYYEAFLPMIQSDSHLLLLTILFVKTLLLLKMSLRFEIFILYKRALLNF